MALPLHPFADAARRTVAAALDLDPALFIVAQPPRPDLGDFAVGCFPAAKLKRKSPAALAAQVAEAFTPSEHLAKATAAGPFVNFHANRPALFHSLFMAALTEASDHPLLPEHVGAGKTVCVDYSSPNISKHLAYHHIRSTVIGNVLVNLHRALGYRAVGINHLGDWGTTHGMLLAAHEMWGAPDELTVDVLNGLYVRFRAEMKTDATLEAKGRAWFKRLEDGDVQARTLWQKFREVSLAEFQTVYDLLGISFEEVRGESAYEKDMLPVLEMLEAKGLSSISEGALVVAFDEDEGMPPLLLRKGDGATLYATRDLAAAIYRWNTYAFDRSLYVVDRGQGLHFRQLFRALDKAGYDWASQCAHVPFGLVRIGGKKTGTRTGNVVLLKEVLADAAQRSKARIRENNPDMAEARLESTARKVGIGAVVFANLASQREKDVDFEWEDVLSVAGDSGPYIQYAHARCCSILRKADTVAADPHVDAALLSADAEWALALKLLDIGTVVFRAAQSNDPHVVSRYLLDLCATFSHWYTTGNQDKTLRVLTDDAALSKARLTLVDATRAILERGLALLGLEAPDVM